MASQQPRFWRDAKMPYVEIRYIEDGHAVRYVPHSHQTWSVGAILSGESSFLCGDRLHHVNEGDLVMMRPNEVHCCNPVLNSPWSYYMMHIDEQWLSDVLGVSCLPVTVDACGDQALFSTFLSLAKGLFSDSCCETKSADLTRWLKALFDQVTTQTAHASLTNARLTQIAYYLIEHCDQDESIDTIAALFGVSASYLNRAFKKQYHMTPHAFRLNHRVQLGQIALKNGMSIADVAYQFGFSDQAHFQRIFKARVAATPRQYIAD